MKNLIPFAAIVILALAAPGRAQEDESDEAAALKAQLQIQKLLKVKDYDAAEQAYAALAKAQPDIPQVPALRRVLASAYLRAKKHDRAVEHITAYFNMNLERFKKDSELVGALTAAAESTLYVCEKAKQNELGMKKLDAALAAIAALREKEPTPSLAIALSQLQGAKVLHLAEQKETKGATALLALELNSARLAHNIDRDDLATIVPLANLLETQADLLAKTSPDKEAKARDEFRRFVAAQAKERSSHAEIVSLYLNAKVGEFYEVVQRDLETATKLRNEFKQYLAHLDDSNPNLEPYAARAEQLLARLNKQLVSSKAHLEMVGKPATQLDVAAWANGSSLTDKDLQGKVVLLDFWAMWCGPCIATFPHLREWQDKYAQKGLVILGVTKYYEYTWDEAIEGIEKVDGLSEAEEHAALIKFAAHHKLKHRFAVVSAESEFHESYGVEGIPQAVLIDRTGKVRLIRVGSGNRNAHDLEEAIVQALAAPAPAAGE